MRKHHQSKEGSAVSSDLGTRDSDQVQRWLEKANDRMEGDELGTALTINCNMLKRLSMKVNTEK